MRGMKGAVAVALTASSAAWLLRWTWRSYASFTSRLEQAEAKLSELDSRPNVLLALKQSLGEPPLPELPALPESPLYGSNLGPLYGLPIVPSNIVLRSTGLT